MSSISLYQHRGYITVQSPSAWTAWKPVSSSDAMTCYGRYPIYYSGGAQFAVYSASLSFSTNQKMTGLQVKVNLFNPSTTTSSTTVTAYLYTSDPTTDSAPTQVPTGYIATAQATISSFRTFEGRYVTFSFTGLDIKTGTRVYVLFYRTQGALPDLVACGTYTSFAAGMCNLEYGSFGTPAISGTFVNETAASVGTPTASVVDLTGNFPSTYIAGYSKVKVSATITPGSNPISTVQLSYPGGTTVSMTLNSGTGKYEATTASPITEDTTFTVTATDTQGLVGTNTVSITVVPYTPPSIVIDTSYTYRCDSAGTQESGGTYYRVKATANYYSALSGNTLTAFTVKIKNDATVNNITSGVQSAPISGMSNQLTKYTLVFSVQDSVSGAITREYSLEGMLRNLVIRRSNDGTYIGVGTTPTRSSGTSCIELPANGTILIDGEIALLGFPVGCIYMTGNSNNPSAVLGGTWTAISQSAIPGVYFWTRTA